MVTIAALAAISLLASNATAKEVTEGYNHKMPQEIMTPNAVQTRLGTLHFYDGIQPKIHSKRSMTI